jgi:hypothetical protein
MEIIRKLTQTFQVQGNLTKPTIHPKNFEEGFQLKELYDPFCTFSKSRRLLTSISKVVFSFAKVGRNFKSPYFSGDGLRPGQHISNLSVVAGSLKI